MAENCGRLNEFRWSEFRWRRSRWKWFRWNEVRSSETRESIAPLNGGFDEENRQTMTDSGFLEENERRNGI